jgi:hypothetical protein
MTLTFSSSTQKKKTRTQLLQDQKRQQQLQQQHEELKPKKSVMSTGLIESLKRIDADYETR